MIIFGKRKPRTVIPLILPEAARVETMRVLGVTIRSDLRMITYVENVLTACSSSMYALRVLRSHGLPPNALQEVTKMTTIAHLMYASPAWWGYTSAGERDRIEQLMKRLRRGQYLPPQSPSAVEMAVEADERLFSSVRNDEHHVLHRLFFPPRPTCGHALRPRAHGFSLPDKDNRNFISRVLYKNIF